MTTQVIVHGNLPHADAFDIVGRCDMLLLLMFETPYSKAVVPHKLYYYLAMGKPVLAIAEENGGRGRHNKEDKDGCDRTGRHMAEVEGALAAA